jgi:hypothetical protein
MQVGMAKRTSACIIGNGPSRLVFDLDIIHKHFVTYGCNALYRDLMPDYLVSHDMGIADEILEKRVHYHTRFYTQRGTKMNHRASIGEPINFVIQDRYMGDSGTGALRLACINGHIEIYMIGFDYSDHNNKVHNVYQGTKHYSIKPLDYAQNFVLHQWEYRFMYLLERYQHVKFIHVRDIDSYKLNIKHNNYNTITREKFKEIINELQISSG